MEVGVLIQFNENVFEGMEKVSKLGFKSIQLSAWNENLFTDEYAEKISKKLAELDMKVSTFWCGWCTPGVWDFYEGPHTLGLVPVTYRFDRLRTLRKGSDFAKKLGIVNVATHVGFLPEVPTTTEYHSLISSLKHLAQHLKSNGQYFLFETGQETPVTLLRTIQDIGLDNLGINLDPANLIMYGKANPVDALEVFGQYVRDIHGKDGCYPTDGRYLGLEKPMGEGKVNYPAFVAKLKEIGYDGPITIEREISGEEQVKDILRAKKMLEDLI